MLPTIVSLSPLRAAVFGWRAAQARMLTVVCKATYTLRPVESPLAEQQEDPNEGDDHWDDDAEKSLRAPSDLVPSKPRAELMVVGSAFSETGTARPRLPVRVIVGELDKALAVIGDRAMLPDGSVGDPAPFTKMALRWERAAGGPGTSNPVGVRAEIDAYGKRTLPNVVPLDTSSASAIDLEPVGLGPIAVALAAPRGAASRRGGGVGGARRFRDAVAGRFRRELLPLGALGSAARRAPIERAARAREPSSGPRPVGHQPARRRTARLHRRRARDAARALDALRHAVDRHRPRDLHADVARTALRRAPAASPNHRRVVERRASSRLERRRAAGAHGAPSPSPPRPPRPAATRAAQRAGRRPHAVATSRSTRIDATAPLLAAAAGAGASVRRRDRRRPAGELSPALASSALPSSSARAPAATPAPPRSAPASIGSARAAVRRAERRRGACQSRPRRRRTPPRSEPPKPPLVVEVPSAPPPAASATFRAEREAPAAPGPTSGEVPEPMGRGQPRRQELVPVPRRRAGGDPHERRERVA